MLSNDLLSLSPSDKYMIFENSATGLFHIWLAKFQANNGVTTAEAGFPVIAGFLGISVWLINFNLLFGVPTTTTTLIYLSTITERIWKKPLCKGWLATERASSSLAL
jgi:hypothetical protein